MGADLPSAVLEAMNMFIIFTKRDKTFTIESQWINSVPFYSSVNDHLELLMFKYFRTNNHPVIVLKYVQKSTVNGRRSLTHWGRGFKHPHSSLFIPCTKEKKDISLFFFKEGLPRFCLRVHYFIFFMWDQDTEKKQIPGRLRRWQSKAAWREKQFEMFAERI